MPTLLRVGVILLSILLILIVIYFAHKRKITIKYSIVWFFSASIIFISAAIPNFIELLADILGFQVASNMLFTIIIGILMFISLSLTIIVSKQTEKVRLLIQEVSILKKDKE